jgi:hypothetical protein
MTLNMLGVYLHVCSPIEHESCLSSKHGGKKPPGTFTRKFARTYKLAASKLEMRNINREFLMEAVKTYEHDLHGSVNAPSFSERHRLEWLSLLALRHFPA